jgi:hypothetical protein
VLAQPHFRPCFFRRFRAHHRRNSPHLCCFVRKMEKNFFLPAPEAPNPIPEGFTFLIAAEDCFMTLGCRHCLVLIVNTLPKQILVLDPVTGNQHHQDSRWNAWSAVRCCVLLQTSTTFRWSW